MIKAAFGYFEQSDLKDFKVEELKSLSDALMIHNDDGGEDIELDPSVNAMVINELISDEDLKVFAYLWECLWGEAFVAYSTDEDLKSETDKRGLQYLSLKEAIKETAGEEVNDLKGLKKHVDEEFE